MTMIQTILLFAVLAIWLCVSAVILISSIQSFLYDRKREKREREQAARDAEYHPCQNGRVSLCGVSRF